MKIILFLLLLTCSRLLLTANAKAPIFIKGRVTADHLDSQVISVKDQFGQVFLIPRRMLKNESTLLIGSPVELEIPEKVFKKLKKLKQ